MELFQEFFVTALLALVFACVIAKLVVSVALYGDEKAAGKVKVIETQRSLEQKGLRVKGSKSKKRVKFADDVVVKHVDYMVDVEEERREFEDEIKSVVNYYYDYDYDVCDEGCESSGVSVESMEEVIVEEKGEILTRVEQVDDQRLIVEEKCENSKRVDQVDDQRVIVDEKGENGENSKRVDQVKDQRVIVEEKSKRGEILTRADQFDDQTSNEDGKVMLCSDEVGGVCGHDGEKVSTNIELLVEALVREIIDGKSEIDESCCVKEENVVIRGIDSFIAEEKMKHEEEVGGTSGSEDMAKSGVGLESDNFAIGLKEESGLTGIGEYRKGLSKGDESSSVKEENVVISDMDISVVDEKVKQKELGGKSGSEDLLVERKVENEQVSAKNDVAIGLKEESRVVELGLNGGGLMKGDEEGKVTNEGTVIDDEDDWEGIERTELEKQFGEAVNYVECGVKAKDDKLANLGSDVQMQLYGLHKIAVEGSCHEPQPMALNFTARAKWNAWQKLGSMSREVAMEEYIKLLSEHSKSSSQDIQPNVISERELEVNYITKGDDPIASGNSD